MSKVVDVKDKPVRLHKNARSTVVVAHYSLFRNPPSLKARTKFMKRCRRGRCAWHPDVKWIDEPSFAYCSGVLVKSDTVLTARHCLQPRKVAANFRVGLAIGGSGSVAIAGVRELPGGRDIVLLQLEHDLGTEVARLAHTKPKGDRAYLISSPLGIPGVYSTGKFSNPGFRFYPFKETYHYAYVAEHSSGGPVFSFEDGNLVGVQQKKKGCTNPLLSGKTIYFPENNGRSPPSLLVTPADLVRQLASQKMVAYEDWLNSREYKRRSESRDDVDATRFLDPISEFDWKGHSDIDQCE